ncbi:MAG TPA: hypothetical protein DCM64_12295 [Gammaproteobacteria bacterium]|jgi:CheY-like chemotaxis protein|nr:hypothetical protein [Gammaproteobacteria bacterium]|tara:strand:- start:94 stop:534 length:441 start_codon:yes stop_codon:yes gene_type:complete
MSMPISEYSYQGNSEILSNLTYLMPVILVAEDNHMNLELMLTILRENGYETLEAADGLAAFELARKNLPDLILMDINMPGTDGNEALDMLRQEQLTSTIPVNAVTGNATNDDIEQMQARGFAATVCKPYRIDDLLATISDFLKAEN